MLFRSYGEINTALVFGTWRIRNRITLTGLYDERTSIFTRNALIGQPVTGFEELLLSWTEEELRQMARDRSATSKTATLGISTPVGERLQINADVTSFEIGPSVDFAAMPAIPGTGQQVYYSVTLVTSALFGIKDVNALNLRYGEGPDFTTTILTWDTRLPLGKHLRLNPRLRFSTWENTATNVRRETLTRMSAPEMKLPAHALPTITFERLKDFTFNGESIQMISVAPAVTDGDSIVYFRGSDVISTGDVFLTTGYPKIDLARGGSIQGEIAALNRIIEIAVPEITEEGGTMIIPGHGRLCDEADVVEYRDMMTILRDRVADYIKQGKTLEQTKAAKLTTDYDGYYSKPGWTGDMLVEAIYKSLKGGAK